MVTLIQAQERYMARINASHPGHINRVRRGARRQLREYCEKRGYDIQVVQKDAEDMLKLENESDD